MPRSAGVTPLPTVDIPDVEICLVGEWNGREFTLIDTGGIELGEQGDIFRLVREQAQLAISYLEAYQITDDAFFAVVARRILD